PRFLQSLLDLLDIQSISVSIAYKFPRSGTGKMGPNDQRRRIRIFREDPATGSNGGIVVHVSGNGEPRIVKLDGVVHEITCNQGLFPFGFYQDRVMTGRMT